MFSEKSEVWAFGCMYMHTDILVYTIRYSEKSDVWAFGVTAWEILTGGTEPYYHITMSEIITFVCGGGRLERKELEIGCPDALWDIISSCFDEDPATRPTFARLALLLAMAETQNANNVAVQQNLISFKVSVFTWEGALYVFDVNALDTDELLKSTLHVRCLHMYV